MSAINESMKNLKKIINFENFSTEKTLNVICTITPALGNIFSDEEIIKTYSDRLSVEALKLEGFTDEEIKVKANAKGMENISKLVPLVLGEHRQDIYKVLAALNDRTIEEIKDQNIMDTIEQTTALLNNEAIVGFFQ